MEMQTSGQQTFLDKKIVHPGESVTAEICVVAPEYFKNKLFVGQKFEFYEASHLIGKGEIIEVVNKELLKTHNK